MSEQTAVAVEAPATESIPVESTKDQGVEPAAEPVESKESEGSDKPESDKTESDYLDDIEFERLKKKKRKMKVDDEDVEMTFEEIIRNTATNKSVTKRGQEAAEMRKFAEENMGKLTQFLEEAKNDPETLWALAERLGHDPDSLAVKRARAAYEWSQKSEAEKKSIMIERENAQLKKEREDREASEAQQSQDAKSREIATEVENDLIAVVKELPFQPDAITAERVAQAITFLYNRDNKKPSAKDAAQFVLQALEQDVARYVKTLAPDKIAEFLGKETVDKLQESLITQAEKKLPYAPSSGNKRSDDQLKPKPKTKEIGIDDWISSL